VKTAEGRESSRKAEQSKDRNGKAEMGLPEGTEIPRFLVVIQKIKETAKAEIS
jgi:hypothetical protein